MGPYFCEFWDVWQLCLSSIHVSQMCMVIIKQKKIFVHPSWLANKQQNLVLLILSSEEMH